MRLERDQKITLGVVAGVAVAAAAALWFPQRFIEQAVRARISSAQAAISTEPVKHDKLSDLSRQAAELREQLAANRGRIGSEPDLAGLLRQISTGVQQCKLSEPEVQTQPILAGADFNVIPVTLRCRGSFASAYAFLTYAESMPRFVRVTSMTVDTNPHKPADPLEIQVQLCGFFTEKKQGGQP